MGGKGLCTSEEREVQILEGREECLPLPPAGSLKSFPPAGSLKPPLPAGSMKRLSPADSMKRRLPVVSADDEVQSEEAEDPERAGGSQHIW